MKLRVLLALLLLCAPAFVAVFAGAQTKPQPPQLLPASFGAWSASGNPSQAAPEQIEQFAGDKASILREYGISSAERLDYAKGAQAATVTLYRMTDPSAAFGAYTFLREPGMTHLQEGKGVHHSSASHDRALLLIGDLVVDVASAKARPSDADLQPLAAALSQRADPRPFPPIEDLLPKEGLVAGSEHYVLGPQALSDVFPIASTIRGDWVGFGSKSAEAMVGRYKITGSGKPTDAVLLMIIYPTQQIASDVYSTLGKSLAINLDPGQANGRPAVFGTRSSALVALVSGIDSRPIAVTFLSKLHYVSQVTWNEPATTYTDPPFSTMVVGAFLGSGFVMVIGLATGLGFAGFKVLMKYLFPGKIFDRNNQVEILQLGLTSKPVEAVDFTPPRPSGQR